MNELVLRWVTFETWTYTAMLPSAAAGGGGASSQTGAVDPLLGCVVKNPRHQELLLLFDGLDTLADVYVGSKLVLQTRNFHRWVLHAGDPHLGTREAISKHTSLCCLRAALSRLFRSSSGGPEQHCD